MERKKVMGKIRQISESQYIFCILLGMLLNLGVESLSRKSILQALLYAFHDPLIFLYNTLLISTTVSVALIFRRRVYFFTILSVTWLLLGLVNSVLLVFRTTPFTAVDLLLIKSAYAIMWNYLSAMQVVICMMLAVLILAGTVCLWKKAPKKMDAMPYKGILIYIVSMFSILYVSTMVCVETGVLASNFGNIGQAFRRYGFPYGFSCSLLNTGIEKPKDYSVELIESLLEEVEPIEHYTVDTVMAAQKEEQVNVIFLQLESFFDPYYVKGVGFSKDPVPVFRSLKRNNTSGFLYVPSVGAGTANTEFEVITGMNLDFFGPGEYPYKTILKEVTCESIAYNLKELDYKAHAIHNNEGTFYERNQVFAQFGFDTFASVEYMNVQEYTPLGWAKDNILTGEIQKALDSTREKDFIYTISVQGHGSYPDTKPEGERQIEITEELEVYNKHAFEYYVNQLYEMDVFLEELLQMLHAYPEQVMLVLYGDHLPGFEFTEDSLYHQNIYATEYVIWTNYPLKKQDRDLEAYQLSAYVMELLGLQNGLLTKYHRLFSERVSYLGGLKILQYDMLYGDMDVYGGENPYVRTELQMGIQPIRISNVVQEEDGILIYGRNLTEHSKVFINGEHQQEEFVSSIKIRIAGVTLLDQDEIVVRQIGRDTQVLSETLPYTFSLKTESGSEQ